MTQPIIDDTHVDRPPAPGAAPFGEQPPVTPPPAPIPPQPPAPPSPPSPADMPSQPAAPAGPDDGDKEPKIKTYEEAMAELEKVRKESAARRVKLKELEPIVQAHTAAEEAAKSELQRANERAEQAELAVQDRDRLEIAYTLGILPENIDLIGSGSRDEMEAKAARVVAMQQQSAQPTPPPPSDRPVEGLRPGASPEPPKPADDSYPEGWKPAHIRDQERAQYGQ